jgi:hypothetical protein
MHGAIAAEAGVRARGFSPYLCVCVCVCVCIGASVMSSSEIRNRVRISLCLPCTIGGDPWKRGVGEGTERAREREKEREGEGRSILRGRKSSNAELARKVFAHARFIRRRTAHRALGTFSRSKRQEQLYHTGAIHPCVRLFSLPVFSSH